MAEGTATAKRGALYDYDLMSEFRKSHPLDAEILRNSIKSKRNEVYTGYCVGMATGCLTSSMLHNRYIRKLPLSYGQYLVGIASMSVVCVYVGAGLGAHVGNNWGKHPPEAEAKFYDWLQNRAELPQINLE